MTTLDVDAAARFLAGNARVLDRRRFERLALGGDARRLEAVARRVGSKANYKVAMY